MCQYPLFETISVIDGQVQNLSYHQQRFKQAVNEFFGCEPDFCLAEILIVPAEFQKEKYVAELIIMPHSLRLNFILISLSRLLNFAVLKLRIGITT